MIFALAALAVVVHPNVTYLTCSSTQRGSPMHYDITLNEQEGTADVAPYNGTNQFPEQRVGARFSADAVVIPFYGARISRVDLTIERNMFGDEQGQCQIAKPTKRAF